MDALCRDKAKTNRRSRVDGTVSRVAATQAAQAKRQEGGGLCSPLWRRHACRVMEVGRDHGVHTGMSNQWAVCPCNHFAVSQRDVVTANRADGEPFRPVLRALHRTQSPSGPISLGTSETDHSDSWLSIPCAQPSLHMPQRSEASSPGRSRFRRYGGASTWARPLRQPSS